MTINKLQKSKVTFKIGPETLKITKWNENSFQGKHFNLERSILFNQPFGGHFVTGHLDGLACLVSVQKKGESRIAVLNLPKEFQKFILEKGIYSSQWGQPYCQQCKKKQAGGMFCA